MNSFEDNIKRKLKNHRSTVDTDSLWNSISEDIPKEKEQKKRGIFFLFFFGLGMAGGIIFIYSNPSFQNEFSHHFYKNAGASLLVEDTYYENNMNFHHQDIMPPIFGYHVSDDNDIANKPVASNSIQSTQLSLKHTLVFPTLSLEKKKGEVNSADISDSPVILPQLQIQEPITTTKKTATAIQTNESLVPVDLLDAEVFAMRDENIEKVFIDEYEEEKEEEQTEKGEKKVKIAFGFTTGYSSSKSNLSTPSSRYEYYAIKRSKLEEEQGTMTLSGDFVLSFHNNMIFRTGVEYTRISELFSFYGNQEAFIFATARPEESSSNNAFIDRDEDEGNETNNSSVVTSSTNTNVRQLNFQSTNRHHFIDIPLIVGYEIGKKKLSLLVEAGVNVNIRTFSTGSILLTDGSYSSLAETDPVFNKNIKMSTYSGLSLNYDLGNNTQLKLGGHLRFNPFSMTRKDNVLKQKYRSTGIHVGILHQF